MRIVVNDIAASAGGALTVLRSFHRYVLEYGGDHEWIFLLGSDLLVESGNIRNIILPSVKSSWLRRLTFDLITGRRLLASLKPDVTLSLQNTYTYGVKGPQVVYVHQSLPFQRAKTFSLWRRDEWLLSIYQHVIGAVIKQSIRRADHVIVQTRWMRDAILDQVGISGDRISSILPDLHDVSAYEVDGNQDTGAFFYPTSDHKYKNNECIYQACRLLRQRGMADFKVTVTLDEPTTEPHVDPIGHVAQETVLEELSRSTLVFPSFIETYGLPLAEARALGCLVLAADLPYAREVLDGYRNAYFFDPASPAQLAALMGKVITGSIARCQVSVDGEVSHRPGQTAAWACVTAILEDFANHGEGQG